MDRPIAWPINGEPAGERKPVRSAAGALARQK